MILVNEFQSSLENPVGQSFESVFAVWWTAAKGEGLSEMKIYEAFSIPLCLGLNKPHHDRQR